MQSLKDVTLIAAKETPSPMLMVFTWLAGWLAGQTNTDHYIHTPMSFPVTSVNQ